MCLVTLGMSGCPLFAQQMAQPAQPASSGGTSGSIDSQGIGRAVWVPYSADEVTVTTQILADGTKVTRKRLVKEYHDTQGRTRYEFFGPEVESAGQKDSPVSVRIMDPGAGAFYNLNPRDHTAQKTDTRRRTPSSPAPPTGASSNLPPTPPEPPQPTREDLGTQVIEGIEAVGERITRTIPAGAVGNDRPMQITEEIWRSARLRRALMVITNDPRYGETVKRLTNLVLEEPAAELFQVPPDYTVQELQPLAKSESPSD
jgi:hypothetical protein